MLRHTVCADRTRTSQANDAQSELHKDTETRRESPASDTLTIPTTQHESNIEYRCTDFGADVTCTSTW